MKRRLCLAGFLIGCAGVPGRPVPESAPIPTAAVAHVCSRSTVSPSAPVGNIVTRVELRGYARSAPAALCAHLQTRAGAALDPIVVRADLQRLWSAGDVDDVVITSEHQADALVLRYTIHERPLLHEIAWSQGGPPAAIDLSQLVPFAVDTPLDPQKLQSYVERLRGALATRGYRRAQVSYVVAPLRPGQASVTFRVLAGPRGRVSTLRFVGAVEASEAALRALVHTDGGKINVVGAPYDESYLGDDLAAIQEYLWNLGLVEAKTPELDVKESADGTAISLTFQLHEGGVFHLGKLSVSGNLAGPPAQYEAVVGLAHGSRFARDAVRAATARLNALHQRLGGPGKLAPLTSVSPESRTVDLVWTPES